MQNLAFSHFGAGFQHKGAANSVAADFTTAKNSGKMGLWQASRSESSDKIALSQGIMQGKAANTAHGVAQSEIHGAKGVEFAAAQSKAANLAQAVSAVQGKVASVAQGVAKMWARVINSTPSKATNSAFSGVRAVFALSRARVSSLSLSLSRSGVFAF